MNTMNTVELGLTDTIIQSRRARAVATTIETADRWINWLETMVAAESNPPARDALNRERANWLNFSSQFWSVK